MPVRNPASRNLLDRMTRAALGTRTGYIQRSTAVAGVAEIEVGRVAATEQPHGAGLVDVPVPDGVARMMPRAVVFRPLRKRELQGEEHALANRLPGPVRERDLQVEAVGRHRERAIDAEAIVFLCQGPRRGVKAAGHRRGLPHLPDSVLGRGVREAHRLQPEAAIRGPQHRGAAVND